MSNTNLEFGHRKRTKVKIDGIEKEVVNVKGAVVLVKRTGGALEIVMHPEASPPLKPFRFDGESPIQRYDYVSAGIILGEKTDGLREALYVISEDHHGLYPKEVHRAYKRGYERNAKDDKELGIDSLD